MTIDNSLDRDLGIGSSSGSSNSCVYHDMGLIGAWLGALYFGIPRPS